jgi:hypothetical protein
MSTENKRFAVLSAADIRRGIGNTKPGWAMGSFVEADNLRYCRDFEIKEWDMRTMRREWRNGEDCGTEYIAVLDGMLTVVLGRLAADGTKVEEDKAIDVGQDQRIILARGVWRKSRATENVKGLTVRNCRRGTSYSWIPAFAGMTTELPTVTPAEAGVQL